MSQTDSAVKMQSSSSGSINKNNNPSNPTMFMIAERRNSHGQNTSFSRLKALDSVLPSDEDMFGNVLLHHFFATPKPDFDLVRVRVRVSAVIIIITINTNSDPNRKLPYTL
jgi:hypothetical protein